MTAIPVAGLLLSMYISAARYPHRGICQTWTIPEACRTGRADLLGRASRCLVCVPSSGMMRRWPPVGGGRLGRGRGAVARRRLGFWGRLGVSIVKPVLFVWTRRDWSGMEYIPAEGGAILAFNHLSEFDPLVAAHYVYDAGRWPQFLA